MPGGRRGGGGGGGSGGGGGGGGGFRHDSQPRSVLVSKALSRLLRHAAVQERIPIDNHGYVRMDHLLAWQRLRSMKPPVTFDEVVEAVEDNEKKRFALKYDSPQAAEEIAATLAGTTLTRGQDDNDGGQVEQGRVETSPQEDNETRRAIAAFRSSGGAGDHNLKSYFIRATQGHSMKTVEAEHLLVPITLADAPDTVVHGTFWGSWERIVESGGLKSMSRNHVHFATGPPLNDVLSTGEIESGVAEDGGGGQDGKTPAPGPATARHGGLATLLTKNKVTSGMRSDAQILIYVDVRRALTELPQMKWWRSENGVILTEGVSPAPQPDDAASGAVDVKIVPINYFTSVVEVREGVGLLWQHGQGVVTRLPDRLRSRGVPRGKGGGGGGPRGGRGNNGRERGRG